jgi:hypothetical protein
MEYVVIITHPRAGLKNAMQANERASAPGPSPMCSLSLSLSRLEIRAIPRARWPTFFSPSLIDKPADFLATSPALDVRIFVMTYIPELAGHFHRVCTLLRSTVMIMMMMKKGA